MKRFVFILISSAAPLSATYAAEWSVTSTLDPSVEYDDNVFLDEQQKSSIHLFSSPTVVLGHALENTSSSLSLGYKLDRYTSLSELDTENPFARLNSNYQWERSSVGLNASYVEDTTRTDAENDTGDFTTQSIVKTKTLAPSYSYQLTERDNLSLNGTYTEREYSTTDFSDNETKSLTMGWQRQYTERLNGGVSATVSNYKSEGVNSSSENDNYNLSLTAGYQWSETWQFSGQVGVRQLKSEQTSFGVTDKNNSSGSSFNFSASHQTELDNITVSISRALSPSSSGDVNEQQGLTVNWSRQLADTLTANLSASYQETTSASEDSNDDKRENISFSPSLRWQFERNLGLNLTYNYREQKETDQADVDGNAVSLTLIYDWDGIRASR